MSRGERVIVVRIPDWPIHAFFQEREELVEEGPAAPSPGVSAAPPIRPAAGSPTSLEAIALIADHLVVACSERARAEGVTPGIREREAQSRCPSLATHPHDPEVDERRFAPVLAAIEALIPGVEPRVPGVCAMRARGPARYYGGEPPAAATLLELLTELGYPETRIGIADGLFAAEQATQAAQGAPGLTNPGPGIALVPAGQSPAFLSRLPVERATGATLANTLHGLGIRTLGALAALPEEAVEQRFGPAGVAAHRAATGRPARQGAAEVRPRHAPRELTVELSFEPPIETAEQLGFACSGLAEQFITGLIQERRVCTSLRVSLTDDTGDTHEREWAHPRRFTASDTVGRIRWQAASIARETERGGAGIVRVRISPVHTDRAAAHEPGLWNTEPDERVHHHLSRIQAKLGHTGVGTAELSGGRLLLDRQRFLPWGTAIAHGRNARGNARRHRAARGTGPWPGSLAGPSPSLLFPAPLPAKLLDRAGHDVLIDEEDLLSETPYRLCVARTAFPAEISGWSLPWAIRERWWTGTPARFRLQVLLENGDAWLLLHEAGRWLAEGKYD
ncbi:DNA polymerase Y family protein [Leucobacter sp. CSA2]|uniref:DNA polymerase Y family protein n=1 Tax=Leucobacter edaphi TaxID=2796472 RepID=A0A934UX78_9MICO|nr:DNA polymerase Y family protein [Leucobacter edaphi]MBK0421023.1 DNA polymerase Y family protein [Leucobacter edaphi]